MAESIQGRMSWYQLNTPDPAAALAFYQPLLGWSPQTWQPEGSPPYTMICRGEIPIGGMMAMPPEADGAPAHWLVYIGADDVDATFEKAIAAGGKAFVPPMDIPETGRFAVLADPWGAMFALWKSAAPAVSPEAEPEVGDISWHEISADDLEASWAFYSSLFGWESVVDHDMGPEMGPYRLFGRAGRPPLGGMFRRPPEMPVNAWSVYGMVKDVPETLAAAEKAGATTVVPTMEVPGGDHIAMFMDPQGAMFAIHQKG